MKKNKNSEFVGIDENYFPRSGSYSTESGNDYVEESVLGNREQTRNTAKKVIKGIGIGYAVFFGIVIVMMFVIMGFGFMMFNKTTDAMKDMAGGFGVSDSGDDLMDDVNDIFNDGVNKQNAAAFNGHLELYKGTQSAFFMESLLDNIVTANTKGEHIVVLAYNGTSVTEPEDIVKIKRSLDDKAEYEVLFAYDGNGFINKCTVTEYK